MSQYIRINIEQALIADYQCFFFWKKKVQLLVIFWEESEVAVS